MADETKPLRSPRTAQPFPRPDPPLDHEHHPTTKIFDYVGLGLLLAPPAVVLEMYLKDDPINWWRVGLACLLCWVSGGLAVYASRSWRSLGSIRRLRPYLIAAENKLWVKALIVATFMAIPIVISPLFSNVSTVPTGKVAEPPDVTTVPRTDYDVLDEKLAKANGEIIQLKADLDAANRRSGNIPDPKALLGIAILRYENNGFTVQEKDDDAIKDVIIQNSMGSGTYTVRFLFNHSIGPFSVSAETLTGGSGLGLLGSLSNAPNYSMGDNGASFVELNFVPLGLLLPETILIKFYRKL